MTEQTPCTIVRRGEGGRFLPGTAGGPGRLPERAIQLRDALLNAITDEEIQQVGRKLLELGMAGDLKALEILLNKLIPKGAATSGTTVMIQNNTGTGNLQRVLEIAQRLQKQRMAESEQSEGG